MNVHVAFIFGLEVTSVARNVILVYGVVGTTVRDLILCLKKLSTRVNKAIFTRSVWHEVYEFN